MGGRPGPLGGVKPTAEPADHPCMAKERSTAPAGWYADPLRSGHVRYWDGLDWTGHVEPAGHPSALARRGPPPDQEPTEAPPTAAGRPRRGPPVAGHVTATGQQAVEPRADTSDRSSATPALHLHVGRPVPR